MNIENISPKLLKNYDKNAKNKEKYLKDTVLTIPISQLSKYVLFVIFTALLNESGFKILFFKDYYYQPFGYSAFWLLSESHFAIHTFPEDNKTYIQLSSCNKQYYLYFKKKVRLC